jgi:N-acetylmuramoyl-L-alanine amidase
LLIRTLVTVVALSVPAEAQAAGYVVQRGDTLSGIAQRSNVSVAALAQANGIQQPDVVLPGQTLYIPAPSGSYSYPSVSGYGSTVSSWTPPASTGAVATQGVTTYSAPYGAYQVQWGDTLFGLALRYNTSVATLRALNPSLGPSLIAGQRLNLCTSCGSVSSTAAAPAQLSAAPAYSAPPVSSAAAPVGTGSSWQSPADSGLQARALITTYAQQYGLESSLPLAIGEQESGFQQSAVSGAGAIGVMQVLPSTASQISAVMERPVNLYSMDDNIHAGVFWLAHLVAQYGGDERLAAAAYYQGSSSLASRGFYTDTVRYVSNAMSLKAKYGG